MFFFPFKGSPSALCNWSRAGPVVTHLAGKGGQWMKHQWNVLFIFPKRGCQSLRLQVWKNEDAFNHSVILISPEFYPGKNVAPSDKHKIDFKNNPQHYVRRYRAGSLLPDAMAVKEALSTLLSAWQLGKGGNKHSTARNTNRVSTSREARIYTCQAFLNRMRTRWDFSRSCFYITMWLEQDEPMEVPSCAPLLNTKDHFSLSGCSIFLKVDFSQEVA